MRLPVLSGFRELDAAPQRFLIYVAVNVVSWQNIVGPAMVLFARKIAMPEIYVGMLLSFLPFTTLLLLVTMPLINYFGPKKVMLWAWFLRNVIACIVFTMPFALATGYAWIAWGVLLTSILGFCLMRALGAGGWLPWLHEIIPDNRRAVYFSTEAALTQVINVLIMVIQALLLQGDNVSVARFLVIYAIGIGMGFMSLLLMWKVPGGEPTASTLSFRNEMGAYRVVWKDRRYLGFLAIASLGISSMSWLGSGIVMYLRDIVQIHDSTTMAINAVASLCVLFTVASWGRFAEQRGSGRAMGYTLFGHVLFVVLILFWGPTRTSAPFIMTIVITFATVFCAAFNVVANRAMLNQVLESQRVGYTAAWTISTSLALGITPLLVGAIVGQAGLMGFRACFIISIVTGLIGAVGCFWLVRDDPRENRKYSFKRFRSAPFRALISIAGITLGMHESNREE